MQSHEPSILGAKLNRENALKKLKTCSKERDTPFNNYKIKKYNAFTLPVNFYRAHFLGFIMSKIKLKFCKKFLEKAIPNQFLSTDIDISVTKMLTLLHNCGHSTP
jgi:hypothetical protein